MCPQGMDVTACTCYSTLRSCDGTNRTSASCSARTRDTDKHVFAQAVCVSRNRGPAGTLFPSTPPAILPNTSIALEVGGFRYLGEGECRMSDGKYGLRLAVSFADLRPWSDGNHTEDVIARCQVLCARYVWCFAAYVTLRSDWLTPECNMVTDRATFEAAFGALGSNQWGGVQPIDGIRYQTYCGGTGKSCSSVYGEGSVNLREGCHCYARAIHMGFGFRNLTEQFSRTSTDRRGLATLVIVLLSSFLAVGCVLGGLWYACKKQTANSAHDVHPNQPPQPPRVNELVRVSSLLFRRRAELPDQATAASALPRIDSSEDCVVCMEAQRPLLELPLGHAGLRAVVLGALRTARPAAFSFCQRRPRGGLCGGDGRWA